MKVSDPISTEGNVTKICFELIEREERKEKGTNNL